MFTWNGTTVKCLPSGAMRSKAQSQGGFSLDADATFVCLASAFGYATTETLVAALLRTKLTYQPHDYRVESAMPFPGGLALRIGVVDIVKGS